MVATTPAARQAGRCAEAAWNRAEEWLRARECRTARMKCLEGGIDAQTRGARARKTLLWVFVLVATRPRGTKERTTAARSGRRGTSACAAQRGWSCASARMRLRRGPQGAALRGTEGAEPPGRRRAMPAARSPHRAKERAQGKPRRREQGQKAPDRAEGKREPTDQQIGGLGAVERSARWSPTQPGAEASAKPGEQ